MLGARLGRSAGMLWLRSRTTGHWAVVLGSQGQARTTRSGSTTNACISRLRPKHCISFQCQDLPDASLSVKPLQGGLRHVGREVGSLGQQVLPTRFSRLEADEHYLGVGLWVVGHLIVNVLPELARHSCHRIHACYLQAKHL